MDKYEYNLKIDQIKSLLAEESYEAAAEIADSINWTKVRNVNALVRVGEVYEKVGRYEESKEILLAAYDRSPIGRMIVYRLAEVAIKMKDITAADEYYREFVQIAPHDNLKYVLRYKISKVKEAPYKEQIAILEEFKDVEYTEEWAYELAYLYHKSEQSQKCIEACDELILWFGDGPYVERALELKMLYQPLTKVQEEKYRRFRLEKQGITSIGPEEMKRAGEYVHDTVEIPQVSLNPERFNTVNLQEEIAKGMQQIIDATEKTTVSDTIDSIKKIVGENIPYLQISHEDETSHIAEEHIETDEEIDGSLRMNFQEMLGEDSDGQMSLVMNERAKLEQQITGQMTIADVLEEWEKTKRAAEAALQEAEARKLESAKARALQEAGDIMERLNDVIPKLDAGVSPKELLEEEYLQTGTIEPVHIDPAQEDLTSPSLEEIVMPELTSVDELEPVPQIPPIVDIPLTLDSSVGLSGMKELGIGLAETAEEIIPEWNVSSHEPEALEMELENDIEVEPELEAEFIGEEIPEFDQITEVVSVPLTQVLPEEEQIEDTVETEQEELQEVQASEEAMDTVNEGAIPTQESPAEESLEENISENSFDEKVSEDEVEEVEIPELPESVGSRVHSDKEEITKSITKKLPNLSELETSPKWKSKTSKLPKIDMPEDLSKEEEILEEKVIDHLTDEQKAIFSYFVPVKGMEGQLCKALTGAVHHLNEDKSAGSGNIIIQGGRGCGKTVLATSLIKVLQKETGHPNGKVGKIDAGILNKKNIQELLKKVAGGCLIIEHAGDLTRETEVTLSLLLENDSSGILVILEDTSKGIRKALMQDDGFAKKFTEKIDVPIFTNDELVSFARSYARELGYEIEEIAILALYNRISNIQRLDQATTLTEVKEIVDEAIERESKGGLKKAFSILTASRYTEDDCILLRERDFE